MKRKSLVIFFVFALFSMMALQANEETPNTGEIAMVPNESKLRPYVMLSPLDTANLPEIPKKKAGGDFIRKVLDRNIVWEQTQTQLERKNFSEKSIYHMMYKMYRYTYKHYVAIPCAYWSKNTDSDSILVSGKIYLPKDRNLKGIVIANHYTITSDIEAPSNTLSTESIFTLKGYAVIAPDYIGYGLSHKEIHPYLHWRSAAQTAVDLLYCMPELLNHYGYLYPTDVVVSGYSQGGAVALGVARMIEENYDNHGGWTVRKLYAGAGPYDPAATYIYSLESDTIGIPAAIPLIVMGLNDAYDLGFDKEDFFLEPLLSNYEEWVLSKKYTVTEINQLMGSSRMSELMTPESLDHTLPLSDMLYEALVRNSNVGYDLQVPAYFMHSLEDQVVPIVNTINLQSQMPDTSQIYFDYGYYGSHMAASVPFLQYVYQDL